MKLYRAVSVFEKQNYDIHREFRTDINTLEAKQFFRSRTAVTNFVERSVTQNYQPPYMFLYIIDIDEICLDNLEPSYMTLDGYEAVSVDEENLIEFNNCVIFVKEEDI